MAVRFPKRAFSSRRPVPFSAHPPLGIIGGLADLAPDRTHDGGEQDGPHHREGLEREDAPAAERDEDEKAAPKASPAMAPSLLPQLR